MKIQHTFKGMLTEEIRTITEDDVTSPNSGYTQQHADKSGKGYETGRAEELLGDHDFWEWQHSEYIKS